MKQSLRYHIPPSFQFLITSALLERSLIGIYVIHLYFSSFITSIFFWGPQRKKKSCRKFCCVLLFFLFGPWGKDFKNLQTPSWTALLLGANWEHKDFIPRRLFLSSSYCRFRYIKKSFPPIISSCGWNILKKVLASFSFSSVNVLIKSRDFCMVKTN